MADRADIRHDIPMSTLAIHRLDHRVYPRRRREAVEIRNGHTTTRNQKKRIVIERNGKQLRAGMYNTIHVYKLIYPIYSPHLIDTEIFSIDSTTWNSSGSGNPTPRREVNKSQYFEGDSSNSDFDENDDEAEEEEQISISSRGRVRKISSKVRGYFRE